MERGVLLQAYSPLGSPNRPWAKPDEPNLLQDPKLATIAKRHGKSPAQIVLRWQVSSNRQNKVHLHISLIKCSIEVLQYWRLLKNLLFYTFKIQRGVVIIPKSVNYNRLKQNFEIFDFELNKNEMAHLDSFECNGRLIVEKIGGKYVVPHCCSTDHPHYPFSIEF